jgi:serine/threonine protein phosphatase PrpC
MTTTIYLLVDPRGWPAALDPEMVNAILQAFLRPQLVVDVYACEVGDRWFEELPREKAVAVALFTHSLTPGWQTIVDGWLDSNHQLYVIYVDDVDPNDVRSLAQMTSTQPVARAPYRLVQQNAVGLEGAMRWVASILQKAIPVTPIPPPVKMTPARWRHLPSNQQDSYYYPEDYTTSMAGVASYRMVAASHRGKTHAHQGTFREDAVALGTTSHWNILAVADGAGTADLARVGSNLAVNSAVAAIKDAMPPMPAEEDVGKAVWAGLRAAYHALRNFATEEGVSFTHLSTTLQLLVHWPQDRGCLVGVAHVGDGIVTAETLDGQYYLLTDPDTDPDDSSRTLFLTSGPLKSWMERTRVYQFDEPLDVVALMTDGLSGDLEPYAELLHTNLFEALRNRVLCYPLPQQERALLSLISYDRRGSFDDRTLAVLSMA